jgi:hypothetical protein
MIPRILVPKGARLPDVDVPSTRRRPSSLDERTLVPNTLPIVQLDTLSTIPSNLPLESIATRVVVPRDVNVEMVQRRDESNLPAQPTDMDERITVPQGAMPPDEIPQMSPVSEELVEPDIIQTGELSFLPPDRPSQRPLKQTSLIVVAVYTTLLLLLIFQAKIFKPHQRTGEEEDIARRQMTVLLPPGALDSLKPSPAPAPHQPVKVDPRVIRKVAPTPKVEAPPPPPTPEPPKKELPSVPQPNAVAPAPKADTSSKGDLPKSPPKLETPDMPVPEKGLILPKQGSPGDTIRDAARNTGRINTPVPVGPGGPLPGGGRAQGGGGRGTAGAGIDLLTDTQGVNFDDYLRRVYLTVKQNWYSVMPASVSLGDQGVVSLQFKIMRDGSVSDDDPRTVYGSGKEPLDRAAVSSIRASNPFQPLPTAFKGPYIELRFTYYYNLPVPSH